MSSDYFIITRFGLGQSSDTFFYQNLPILEGFLYRSLLNQSDKNFTWVVLTDSNIPEFASKRLHAISKTFNNMKIYRHDPFSNFSLLPNLNEVLFQLGAKPGSWIINTRVDSDDSLATNYVEVIRKTINNLNQSYQSLCINAVDGTYLYLKDQTTIRMRKLNYSVQSIYYKFNLNVNGHVHSWSHQKLVEEHTKNGNYSIVQLANSGPMWLRTIRKDSMSRNGGAISFFETRLLFIRKLRYLMKRIIFKDNKNSIIQKVKLEHEISLFNIDESKLNEAAFIENSIRLNEVPGLQRFQNKSSKLTVKTEILQEAKLVNEVASSHETKSEMSKLKELFYSF